MNLPIEKRRRGRPRGAHYTETLPVRVPFAVMQAIDARVAEEQAEASSRSKIIRSILEAWLAASRSAQDHT